VAAIRAVMDVSNEIVIGSIQGNGSNTCRIKANTIYCRGPDVSLGTLLAGTASNIQTFFNMGELGIFQVNIGTVVRADGGVHIHHTFTFSTWNADFPGIVQMNQVYLGVKMIPGNPYDLSLYGTNGYTLVNGHTLY